MRDVLSFEEATEFLGIGKTLLRQCVNEGRIPYARIGRRIVFSKKQLLDWIEKGGENARFPRISGGARRWKGEVLDG